MPLGLLLFIAAVYLVVKSPKKPQTLGRMAIGFAGALLLCLVPPILLQIGDPQAWGKVGAIVALLMAVVFGWWHLRSLTRAKNAGSTTT